MNDSESPVLSAYVKVLSNRVDGCQLLAPMIQRLIGTRTTPEVDRKRMFLLVDSAVREIAPIGLDAVGWHSSAARLRGITPIVDRASVGSAIPVILAVKAQTRTHTREDDDRVALAENAGDDFDGLDAALDAAERPLAEFDAFLADAFLAALDAAMVYIVDVNALIVLGHSAFDFALLECGLAESSVVTAASEAHLPIMSAAITAFERTIAV